MHRASTKESTKESTKNPIKNTTNFHHLKKPQCIMDFPFFIIFNMKSQSLTIDCVLILIKNTWKNLKTNIA